jgi:hypothetical protein
MTDEPNEPDEPQDLPKEVQDFIQMMKSYLFGAKAEQASTDLPSGIEALNPEQMGEMARISSSGLAEMFVLAGGDTPEESMESPMLFSPPDENLDDQFSGLLAEVSAPPSKKDVELDNLLSDFGWTAVAHAYWIIQNLAHLAYHLRKFVDNEEDWKNIGSAIILMMKSITTTKPYLVDKANAVAATGLTQGRASILLHAAFMETDPDQTFLDELGMSIVKISNKHWLSGVADQVDDESWLDYWARFFNNNPFTEEEH